MSLKNIVSAQYKQIVNQATKAVAQLNVPREGWIRTVRKALGMSVVQLGNRLDVSRGLVARAELEELNGSVTLKTMHKMAQALGCRFVYAVVPESSIEDLILAQAKLKAKHIVSKTNIHMALENQLLANDKIQFEIEKLTLEIIKENHPDLWSMDWEPKK